MLQPEAAALSQIERRLAAILAADVVGYSRLLRADEVATLAALKAYRSERAPRSKLPKHVADTVDASPSSPKKSCNARAN